MGAMPAHIAKGPILEKFDDFINSDRNHLKAALLAYQSGSDIWKAIDWGHLPAQSLLSQAEVNHIVKHWFPEHGASLPPNTPAESPFWGTLRPLGPVFRQGLIQALELCDENPDTGALRPQALPLDTYWICTQTHFEMCVTIGYAFDTSGNRVPHHVNLLILTPNPPIARHEMPTSSDLENLWIVQHSAIEPGSAPVGVPLTGHVVTSRPYK